VNAFDYVAANARGELVAGIAWAKDEQDLDRKLESQGMVLTRARSVTEGRGSRPIRVRPQELVLFTSQLATVTGAGIPLVEGLAGIRERTRSRSMRRLLEELGIALRSGETLSKVMGSYPGVFPPVYRASVQAGEASGALDRVLVRLAAHLEWVQGMRAAVSQALIYPMCLFAAVLGLIVILLYFLLPRILVLFPAGVADLPMQTRIVMALSTGLRANASWIVLLSGAGLLGLFLWRRTARGRASFDGFLLRVPRLGPILRSIASSKFACTASILQSAGCEVFSVLEISASTCGNACLARGLRRSAELVRQGAPISEALASDPRVDPLLVQMVSVGEKTGALDRCLEKLVAHYDHEIPRVVKRFLALLEPAILIVAGIIVAFILLAALLPIFQLYETMR